MSSGTTGYEPLDQTKTPPREEVEEEEEEEEGGPSAGGGPRRSGAPPPNKAFGFGGQNGQFEKICSTEMCSGSEAGSYGRLIDKLYDSTLVLRVVKQRRGEGGPSAGGGPRRSGAPPPPPAESCFAPAERDSVCSRARNLLY